MTDQERRDDLKKRQENEVDRLLEKITTAEFWTQFKPGTADKFRQASLYLFAHGVEFGLKEMAHRLGLEIEQ